MKKSLMYNAMDVKDYDYIISKMRKFFKGLGYVEVPSQSNMTILAACEDPATISRFDFAGKNWPLPQTGQVTLESVLLMNPDIKGVFDIVTSFRDEPYPIEGRHDKIFPMFEFEGRGDVSDLIKVEGDLCKYLGLERPVSVNYMKMCSRYNTTLLEDEHETLMQKDFGNSISLESFPFQSHPFWNMKHRKNNIFNKVDVLLYGMETIGSAERSCNIDEMLHYFKTVSNGEYAKLLFNKFTKERVMAELKEYFSYELTPRFGAGIGVTRMQRALKLAGILKNERK